MKADVYKITLMVIDFERMGAEEVRTVLQNNKYLSPSVRDFQVAVVEGWEDSCPLNQKGWELAFDCMFPSAEASK